jgi:hypothetical protein
MKSFRAQQMHQSTHALRARLANRYALRQRFMHGVSLRRRFMKRFIFGFIWFIIFRLLIGGIFGVAASLQVDNVPGTNPQKLGYDASMHVQEKYNIWFLLASLGLAITGTRSGVLPGTKKPKADNES